MVRVRVREKVRVKVRVRVMSDCGVVGVWLECGWCVIGVVGG